MRVLFLKARVYRAFLPSVKKPAHKAMHSSRSQTAMLTQRVYDSPADGAVLTVSVPGVLYFLSLSYAAVAVRGIRPDGPLWRWVYR